MGEFLKIISSLMALITNLAHDVVTDFSFYTYSSYPLPYDRTNLAVLLSLKTKE